MIKFTIIFVIVYFVLYLLTKIYVDSLDVVDKYMLVRGHRSTLQTIWFVLLGLMKVLSIVFASISGILLVVTYL